MIDRFILSGSTTRGDSLSSVQRAAILDVWADVTQPSRLLTCCWCHQDLIRAEHRGIRPIVVMSGLDNQHQAPHFLAHLPTDAYVYSHPRYTRTVLDTTLAGTEVDNRNGPASLSYNAAWVYRDVATIALGEIRSNR